MIFITLSYIVTTHDPHVYDPHEKEISHSVLSIDQFQLALLDIELQLSNCSLHNTHCLCGHNPKCVEFNKFKHDISFGA